LFPDGGEKQTKDKTPPKRGIVADSRQQLALGIRLNCNPQKYSTPKRDHFVVAPIHRYLCLLTAGFKLKQNDLDENPVRTYHRIIEAFKFAYKYRSMLADPDYEKEVNKVCCHKELLSFCLGLLVRGNVC